MSALVISMSTSHGIVVGLVLIAAGAFVQYRVGLEVDDYRDVKDQQAVADRDAVLDALGPVQHADDPAYRGRRVPPQRDGGAS